MKRIAIGGISIESCTFSPLLSTLDDFLVLRGNDLLQRYPFLPAWKFQGREDIQWLPCFHARAIPGGPVQSSGYESLKDELLERIRAALPLDGFYLDVHGAMNVAGMDDAEAGLARAIRRLVGPACRVSVSADLHGNFSAEFISQVDLFTAYRTAPHEDVMATREKACRNLIRCLDDGLRPCRAWVRVPVVLPGERTSTAVEPGRTVYGALTESDTVPGILDASLCVGYVWADEPRSSASVVVTATSRAAAQREALKIARRYWDARAAFKFCVTAGTADWCIAQALLAEGQPVFISDSGDNPTAGGAGDIPYLAGRLLAQPEFAAGRLSAVCSGIPDRAAVAACYQAGVGRTVQLSLGGKLDPVNGSPLELEAQVVTLVPGDHVGGDLAVVRRGGVQLVLTSRRKPFLRLADFTALGLDPARHKVVAVKLGYLEPELRAAAKHAFLALTPGAVNQDIASLPFRRVQRPIYPLDPDMTVRDLDVRVFHA
jgi:microcystin degradation protein MlrC